MRELAFEGRECNVCGARVQREYACEASNVEARGVSFVEEFEGDGRVRAPRERSGLAHAAGFAGVLYLFRYSLAPLAVSQLGAASAVAAWLVIVWSLFAPLALALAFAAGVSLDRSREKSGALPALFGLVVGLVGTVAWILMLNTPWLKYLKAF